MGAWERPGRIGGGQALVERQAQQGEGVGGVGGQQRDAVGGVGDGVAGDEGAPVAEGVVDLGPAGEVPALFEGLDGRIRMIIATMLVSCCQSAGE
ncbi:hypothetical protein [Kitasatospora sp. NPDC050463]|uniref:hypothetical protein n=1 Tax=Kitasatospora sp. NPDC050463 TaxID=3155786 RepID=UPI0033CB5486